MPSRFASNDERKSLVRTITCKFTGPVSLGLILCASFTLLLSILPRTVPGQVLEPEPGDPVVSQLRLRGDLVFPRDEVMSHIRTRPNRRLFGIPGVTPWRWLYQLGERGCCFGRGGARAFMEGGEPPAYLDLAMLQGDIERLRVFYTQEGFRQANISAEIDTLRRDDRVRVTFLVDPGDATYVRWVRFDGVEHLEPAERDELIRRSLLRSGRPDAEEPLGFTARRQRFSEPQLLEERRRILSALRDDGFAAITRDSVRAVVVQAAADSFDVTFRIRTGDRYRFGDIHFQVTGPEQAPERVDTMLIRPHAPASPGGMVTARIRDERRLRAGFLLNALRMEPGDWYDQSKLLATRRRLEAAGIFTFSDFVPLWDQADTVSTLVTAASPRLSHRIELRTRRRHQVRLETFMVQRTGLLGSGTGTELGSGIAASYNNANIFGGGETFQLRTGGSIAADVERAGLLATVQGEASASLLFPYLIAPFGWLDDRLDLYEARSRLSLNFLTARRQELIIRGRMAAQMRLEMRHTPSLTSIVDVLDFNLSDPDTAAGFARNFLDRIEDPVERERLLEDFSRPQVNNAFRYGLRALTANPLLRDRGYSYEIISEVGGNLPYLLDRFVFSPDTLEGSLPGIPIFRGDDEASRLVYRQYVRLVADLRQYRPLNRTSVVAWKAIAGIAHPIGQSDVVPFDRRFYIGGASSVRGWALHQLGPGSIPPTAESIIRGGDIKLEASAEFRSIMIRRLFAANWIFVMFADAGNVWFGPRNPGDQAGHFDPSTFFEEVAVGSGAGLRIAWDYFILRFDLAYRVHGPLEDQGFLPDGFRSPRLHFGIGHAF